MILLIDNYDSFVYNLARYFARLGQQPVVFRNDAVDVVRIRQMNPQAIVISPGPGTPNEAGCSLEVVRQLHREYPILGVCLGQQTIAQALGGRIVRASEPMHGRTSPIEHRAAGIFAGLPSPLTVCRYHSLVVDERALPAELEITARTPDRAIMALEHRSLPVVGLQFHPESILTDAGYVLLANFLSLAQLPVPAELPTIASERREPPAAPITLPHVPVPY